MEYAENRLGGSAVKPTPELGKLKAVAERLAVSTHRVENFLARFHGEHPSLPESESNPGSDCYRNDLTSVFERLDRLELVIEHLAHIG